MPVDALAGSHRVRGKTAGKAFRQQWTPVPLCVVDPAAPDLAVGAVAARITEIHVSRSCGAFLFIDDGLNAYVISEERPVAMEWVRTHLPWLVGLYVEPELGLDGIDGDVAEHLRDLGALR